GGRAQGVLGRGYAEEEDGGHSGLDDPADGVGEPIERVLILTRHRRDFAGHVAAMVEEERIDEVVHVQAMLAHHVAQARMVPQAAWSLRGKARVAGLHGPQLIARGAGESSGRTGGRIGRPIGKARIRSIWAGHRVVRATRPRRPRRYSTKPA